mmetsp:Transcript_92541/g.289704  ORF Transcript_92541/g.289704 Transcript_92541/m.289704 type:complete len:555 (+) Transcript_92541:66-1730(+)
MAPQGGTQTQPDANQEYVEGRLLDGFLMLAGGSSSTPDEVVSVNLSSLQIVDVAEEDLSFFGHLDRLDVSDNQLSYENVLEQLGNLPKLGLLTLACNAISSILVPGNALRHLRSLDLSFNELHGDVLGQLSVLPSLERLDLSSNCISSVPPEEELRGYRALEELILDNNDLVQFIQWRALDAAPRLKRLSLATNRIKRVRDDAPDFPSGEPPSYFPALEDIDLSSNEIASVSNLPALSLFQSLRVLNLNDNPCSSGPGLERAIPGVAIKAWVKKPWYLEGGGCFQRKKKATEPRLKLNRQKMRRVRSMHDVGPGRRRRSASQVGILDEGTNQLVITSAGAYPAEITPGGRHPLTIGGPELLPASSGILDDDLSEDELEQILRERRAKIDQDFKASSDEPRSFMRTSPFPEDDMARCRVGSPSRIEEESSITALSGVSKRSSSALFLTGLGDEASDMTSPPARFTKQFMMVQPPSTTSSVTPGVSPIPTVTSAAAGGVTLPPIMPGFRESSAGGAPITAANDGISLPRLIVPGVGVHEAMRALRAAAMSEYAVAV